MMKLLSLLLVSAVSAPPSDCPRFDDIQSAWIEEASLPPGLGLPAAHWKEASIKASPMLIAVRGEHFWFGVSHRSDALARRPDEPGCWVTGAAAFYILGPENDPQVDFVRVVQDGREELLGARLIELRWFSRGDGKRRRWYNAALARELGWDPSDRPLPLFTNGINSLY